MRGVYKRGKIYWVRYAGPDGRIIRESARTTNYREACHYLIKKKQLVIDGKWKPPSEKGNFTLAQLAEEYLQWAKRQKSYDRKVRYIRQLLERFGDTKLNKFNTRLLEQFQTERLNKGNKPATVNRLMATLKHMFTRAVEWDMVSEEVLRKVRKVKMLKENNRRLRYLTYEECQRLIEACSSDELKSIVIIALNTGMRKSEILKLKWSQIDFKHGYIHIEDSKNHERREVPMNRVVMDTLRKLPRHIDTQWVFYNPETKTHIQNIKRSFSTALKKAGIKDFRFHDLRHTFASHMVMAGIDLMILKEILGHKDIKMTMRYSHLSPSFKKAAVETIGKAFRRIINE